MRQLLVSIFTLLLTTAIALALDPQTKAEIDELISYVADLRRSLHSQRHGIFRSSRVRSICATNLPRLATA